MSDVRDIMFVGNGRCYHTIDWYRSARRLCHPARVLFATDLIESEGHVPVLKPDDEVVHLVNIDGILFPRQSTPGHIWRNFVKLLLLPWQAARLRRLVREHPVRICHAHSMYYMFLCGLAGVPFVGTPQGSEVLVRPWRSALYKYFAIKSLKAAKYITVDSVNMQEAIMRLCGREAAIVQNGIDITAVMQYVRPDAERSTVVSIRGFDPLYRLDEIVRARDASAAKPDLVFTYPSWNETYKAAVVPMLKPGDRDLGRVMPKERLYEILSSALLAVSIPASDSSPRSVYEAIFCGCCVAATPAKWIDALPGCMRSRLFVVDMSDPGWFDAALARAREVTRTAYVPSDEALGLFDQLGSMRTVVNAFYGIGPAGARTSDPSKPALSGASA